MRVLLDENLPVDLAAEFGGLEVTTVRGLGWQGITNGELLQRAQRTFDVFVTMDRNLEFQQNISSLDLCIVSALSPSNRIADLLPVVPAILQAIESGQPAEHLSVGG